MYNQQPYYSQNNMYNQQKKGGGLALISIIIGLVSFVLYMVLCVLIVTVKTPMLALITISITLILTIAGAILGIVSKPNDTKKVVGIIINIISFVIAICMFFLVILKVDMFNKLYSVSSVKNVNDVSGYYNCTSVNSQNKEYLITLDLNADNTFLYGPYGGLENNYAKGTYTYIDEEKTDNSGRYKYYKLHLTAPASNFVIDGVPSASDFNSNMEFGLTTVDGKREGVIMFIHNYKMFYCYEQ